MSISFGELLVIMIVMLCVIGPQRFPSVIRVFTKRLASGLKMYNQFKKEVLDDFHNHEQK